MAFDPTPTGSGGGDPYETWCNGCGRPILRGERVARLNFLNDPDGRRGLSGTYHEYCSKPFRALATLINMNR